MTSRMIRTLAIVALAPACLLDLPKPDSGSYACGSGKDCLDGYACVAGVCRRDSSGDPPSGDPPSGDPPSGDPSTAGDDREGDAPCATGWTGAACDQCATGHYGASCDACQCGANSTCDEGLDGTGDCTCFTGYEDCTGGPADGCETYVINGDPAHCGDCLTSCNYGHAAGLCTNSTCELGACDTDWGNCNGEVTDGCETYLMGTDTAHCGACNDPCLIGESCDGGSCAGNTVDCLDVTCAQDICVETGRYNVTNEIVVDLNNGRRLWQRAFLTDNDFTEASNFCNNATIGGLTDWRLPTYDELAATLYQAGGLDGCPTCNPAVDQAAFPDVPGNGAQFWTTDPYMDMYYTVAFCDGRKNYRSGVTEPNYARCTHDPVD